jgi:hypothetical protein
LIAVGFTHSVACDNFVKKMDLYSDEEAGVITHDHPAFDGFDTTQVDAMIEKVGGNDADAALRLQAVVKLLESAKTSVKVIEVCVLCFVYMSFYIIYLMISLLFCYLICSAPS